MKLLDLKKHRNLKHEESHCTHCKEKFRSTEELSKHEVNNHGKKKDEVNDTKPEQCETPVGCELIGCCWCKYQS